MKVNGKDEKLTAPVTLEEYLTSQGYDCSRIAVEKNGEIISKAKYQSTQLSDADLLEIVHFVGGG